MIRDRDRIYGAVVTRRLRAMGIRDKPIAPASPWQNGFAERLIGSIRRECVDHVIALGEAHLRRVLKCYADYCNNFRTRMRRFPVWFSESEVSNHAPSLADFTTTTPELKFSVHTGYALDDPEPVASQQASAARPHAEPESKWGVCLPEHGDDAGWTSRNVIVHSTADPIRFVQEERSVAERRFGVLINSHDDGLDVREAPAFARS
jgi:hypothetical protein